MLYQLKLCVSVLFRGFYRDFYGNRKHIQNNIPTYQTKVHVHTGKLGYKPTMVVYFDTCKHITIRNDFELSSSNAILKLDSTQYFGT